MVAWPVMPAACPQHPPGPEEFSAWLSDKFHPRQRSCGCRPSPYRVLNPFMSPLSCLTPLYPAAEGSPGGLQGLASPSSPGGPGQGDAPTWGKPEGPGTPRSPCWGGGQAVPRSRAVTSTPFAAA